MTHTTFRNIRFFALPALLILAPRVNAADEIRVPWTDLCKTASDHQLTIQTVGGDSVEGYCMSISVNEVAINTKNKGVVKIARTALARINMQPSKHEGHQLRWLGQGMHKSLRKGFGWLFSVYAPAGIVAIPATLAWGAVSAPFCLIGDLAHAAPEPTEIKVI
jgi:hypothetical protein